MTDLGVTHHYLDRPGNVRFHYVSLGEKTDEPVVFVHGCPEFWYEWRHVMPVLAAAGFRTLAIDMRGFGETTEPLEDESFMSSAVIGDIVAMLDAEDIATAHIVGHDWGGPPTWLMARVHSDRLKSVTVLSTPLTADRKEMIPMEVMTKILPQMAYQECMAYDECRHAAKEFGDDSKKAIRFWFLAGTRTEERHLAKEEASASGVVSMPTKPGESIYHMAPKEINSCKLLTEDEVAFYAKTIDARPNGWRSMMYWYRDERRQLDHNWAAEHVKGGVTIPAMMVTSEYDPVLTAEMSRSMEKLIPHLRRAHAKNSGHWIASSEPEWLANELLKFYRDLKDSSKM